MDRVTGLGIDMSLPVVYRLGADSATGLFAEFDIATSPSNNKVSKQGIFQIVPL